jgi:hypothetical protein
MSSAAKGPGAPASRSVSVMFQCRQRHEHALCIEVPPGVPAPAPLRCSGEPGYSLAGGGCTVPRDIAEQVARALRDRPSEWFRLGHVVVRER